MAAVGCSLAGSGPQSPLNRNLERSFDEAQVSGELKIGSRRLREFPKIAAKYQLDDTVYADLSKNKLTELPVEVTRFTSLEKLNLYHNVIRSIPDAVVYLQCLTYLDISRNQLSVLPANLCKLPLQVLLVNHNRLVSLPEEISQLTALLELDASCNQLSRLPVQTGDLQQLQVLNLRKNFLVELPKELMFLKLVTLDVSENRIATLPVELRFMVSLVELSVEHNPLTSPPTYLCTRGRIHIFKYLELESIKEDRKRGLLEAGGLTGLADCRRAGLPPRKPSTSSLPQPASQPQPQPAPLDPRRKRFTVDNGQAPPPPPPPPPLPPPPPPPPPPLAPSQPASVSGEVPSEVRWPHDARDALNGRHTPSEPPPPQPPPSAASSNGVESKLGDRWPDDDEQEKEERRRAARKILEQQMSTVADERLPGHIQTYREYKEALRQQRSGHVYRRDSSAPPSHTPSPDTPPGPAPGHALQAPLPPPEAATCPPGSTMTGAASRPAPPPVPFSPPPLTRTLSSSGGSGQATRPLQLNVGHCHDVKSAQKEAVLSYVMAKSSPPGGMKAAGPASHPPPYRSPNAPDPSNPPSKGPGPASAPPPYRPAPSDPASAFRSVSRLPRHTAPSNSHGLVNGNTNGNITGNNNAAAAATATTPTTNGNDAGGAPTTPVSAPMSPSKRFTVRRELDKQREEMEQIQQLRQVIESRLKVVLPEDVGAALQDGVVLCHLANHVRPRSVASIHVPSPAVPKLTIARQRRNIDNFVDACRRLGVPEERLCTVADVLERRSLTRVAGNVAALMAFHRGRPSPSGLT